MTRHADTDPVWGMLLTRASVLTVLPWVGPVIGAFDSFDEARNHGRRASSRGEFHAQA